MRLVITSCVFVLFIMSGCAAKPQQAPDASNLAQNPCLKDAPMWVVNGGAEGGISGVGAATIGKAGLNYARTEALSGARDEIVRTMNVKVNNMIKTFTQTTGLGEEQTVDKLTANVSQQVASLMLSGSKQSNSWVSACNEIYVLVGIDTSAVASSVEQQTLSSFKNEAALWQQFQAKNGHAELREAADKEFGALQTPAALAK